MKHLIVDRDKLKLVIFVFAVSSAMGCWQSPELSGEGKLAAAEAKGQQIFERESCVSCHVATIALPSPAEVTGFVPDLRQTPRRTRDWYLAYLVSPRALLPWSPMPSYGYLSNDELAALTAFLQRLHAASAAPALDPAPAEAIPETPKNLSDYNTGRAIYRTYCAGCHGESGSGGGPVGHLLSPEPRDFTDAIWMSKQTEAYLFSVIANGKPDTAMPAFRDGLSPRERALALRYVEYFADPVARERMELGFVLK